MDVYMDQVPDTDIQQKKREMRLIVCNAKLGNPVVG